MVEEAKENQPFYHSSDPELVEYIMQEFSQFAVFAELTLRNHPNFDPDLIEDVNELSFYKGMTRLTFKLTAKHYGPEAVERSGSLFLHISAIKYLDVIVAHRSLSYPPL